MSRGYFEQRMLLRMTREEELSFVIMQRHAVVGLEGAGPEKLMWISEAALFQSR